MPVEFDLPISPEILKSNLAKVKAKMEGAAQRRGVPAAAIKLLAVTKYVSIDEIRILIAEGETELCENRVQVAKPKVEALVNEMGQARWRFIGHLQTNKVKQALKLFQTFDGVDSKRVLNKLAEEAKALGFKSVPCLLEINVSGEEQKYGFKMAELPEVLEQANALPELKIEGLMCMAPYSEDAEKVSRPVFKKLRAYFEDCNAKGYYHAPLTACSMGMTNDYEIAIEEGATMVRVGRALYL